MVKADSERLNVRLRSEAKFALEDLAERWLCSKTAALERAILQCHSGAAPVPPQSDWTRGRNTIERTDMYIQQHSDPAKIPGVTAGMPPPKPPVGRFPCKCKHSGCRGSQFMGTRRYMEMCSACEESGHRGDPSNCGPCTEGLGI